MRTNQYVWQLQCYLGSANEFGWSELNQEQDRTKGLLLKSCVKFCVKCRDWMSPLNFTVVTEEGSAWWSVQLWICDLLCKDSPGEHDHATSLGRNNVTAPVGPHTSFRTKKEPLVTSFPQCFMGKSRYFVPLERLRSSDMILSNII